MRCLAEGSSERTKCCQWYWTKSFLSNEATFLPKVIQIYVIHTAAFEVLLSCIKARIMTNRKDVCLRGAKQT